VAHATPAGDMKDDTGYTTNNEVVPLALRRSPGPDVAIPTNSVVIACPRQLFLPTLGTARDECKAYWYVHEEGIRC